MSLLRLNLLRWANLSLLILLPISWTAPLMQAAILPIFGMRDISIISGLEQLWRSDVILAAVVALFALVAPFGKVLLLAAIQFGCASPRLMPLLHWAGRLAMADIFLIALYIVIAKGAGHVTVTPAWGLYLFTACVLASLAISHIKPKA